MLNEILNLEGVAVLSKEQQKSVNGGRRFWGTEIVPSPAIGYNSETGQCFVGLYSTYYVLGIATSKPKLTGTQVVDCP